MARPAPRQVTPGCGREHGPCRYQRAEPPRVQLTLRLAVERVEAIVEPHHPDHVCVLPGLQDTPGVVQRRGERLLQIDVLAVPQRGEGRLGVERVRQADDDRVELRPREQLVIALEGGGGRYPSTCALAARGIHPPESDELDPTQSTQDVEVNEISDPAAADQAQLDMICHVDIPYEPSRGGTAPGPAPLPKRDA